MTLGYQKHVRCILNRSFKVFFYRCILLLSLQCTVLCFKTCLLCELSKLLAGKKVQVQTEYPFLQYSKIICLQHKILFACNFLNTRNMLYLWHRKCKTTLTNMVWCLHAVLVLMSVGVFFLSVEFCFLWSGPQGSKQQFLHQSFLKHGALTI